MRKARSAIAVTVAAACVLLATGAGALADAGAAITPEAVEFFEARVRPLLVAKCLQCHGEKKVQGGLRLDSRAAILKGADSGPVVVPGKPEESPLVEAIGYAGIVQMPPSGKLSQQDIETLITWVKLGLPFPEAAAPQPAPQQDPAASAAAEGQPHWAFQPVSRHEPPAVKDEAWGGSPIDRFVLAKLEASGLAPSPAADRRTLLRRVKFDLVGLPPSEQEIAEFEADTSPQAFERVVDRLLASPAYGERWGRHWLDVARYADTKGYVFTEERRYAYSYTYRDYCIRALNEDLPFNRFILEQIAADQLSLGDDKRPLAAMGFLTLGRRFSNNKHDIIDDRIDVVTRGLLGLSVTCARCHDHKFDPIPTADYYSLYGVFDSCEEPADPPLIGMPMENEAYSKYMQELGTVEKELNEFVDAKLRELLTELRTHVGDYLERVLAGQDDTTAATDAFLSFNPGEIRPQVVGRWRRYLNKADGKDPVFGPWKKLAALPADGFSAKAAEILAELEKSTEADAASKANPKVLEALKKKPPESMQDVARAYGELFADIERRWQDLETRRAAETDPNRQRRRRRRPEPLPDPYDEQVRLALYADSNPTSVKMEDVERLFDRESFNKHRELEGKRDQLKAGSPVSPPRAMALVDAAKPVEPHVFLRGNPARRGEQVPRQFLAVLSGPDRKPFSQGSGRLELAEAIARPDNPLTARVIVNRVWLHHFGAGLVRTPSDFGTRGEPPTHPELLDYLAATFMEDGWSLKKLHKRILLSNTYQQSSGDRPDAEKIDPENRLLARMNRRRLEFEALRDSLLAVSGRLDTALEGRSVDIFKQPFSTRRSVYAYLDRQDLPGLFRVFDVANPDVSTAQRAETTVPQQALYVMNSPFVIEQVRSLAARPEVVNAPSPAERVQALFRLTLSRSAAAEEVAAAIAYVNAAGAALSTAANEPKPQSGGPASAAPVDAKALSPWERLAQTLVLTNEFAFVD